MDENNQQSNQESAPAAGEQTKAEVESMLAKLEAFLDDAMVKKAPFQIPMGGKEFLVKIAPYLVILGVILAIPATIMVLIISPLAVLSGGGIAVVGFLFSLGALVLEAMALPGLFKRTRSAWRLLFYAMIVSVLGSIVGLYFVNAIIGAIIGAYILFQVKELYKN